MSATSALWVFGYASLLGDWLSTQPREVHRCRLLGHRRVWGVAMDNTEEIAGYKVYADEGGRRPRVAVAFLDLAEAEDGAVDGLALPASPASLDLLDARERSYRRIEVTGALDPDPGGRVFCYVGARAARAHLQAARRDGRACVAAPYLERVRRGLAALDVAVTEPPEDLPVLSLDRVDLPVPP